MTLTGVLRPSRGQTLRTAVVLGDLLAQTQWDIQSGSVGAVLVGRTVHDSVLRAAEDFGQIVVGVTDGSDFGAGVPMDLLQTSRHVPAGASHAPGGTIGLFLVRGPRGSRGPLTARLFADSHISAGVKRLLLLNWDGQGGLWASANDIGLVRHTDLVDPSRSWTWNGQQSSLEASPDDFVHII